jgi:NAD(P)-dependent dehydrogenase (short-subunit alcohol dehydrogenase family)
VTLALFKVKRLAFEWALCKSASRIEPFSREIGRSALARKAWNVAATWRLHRLPEQQLTAYGENGQIGQLLGESLSHDFLHHLRANQRLWRSGSARNIRPCCPGSIGRNKEEDNNAGILTPGPLEVLPLDAVRHEFEVNVFGALSVMNAFLPALRKARGRIVQITTWTASLPLPFNGPSGASKAAMEVFATVYRAELKRFGIDVVVAPAGNMKTGGPAKTAAALARVAEGMTAEQRELYGGTFGSFATALNRMQDSGLDSVSAARRVIEIAEQVPPPTRAPVGSDSEEILRAVREQSDAELDALRFRLTGLDPPTTNGNESEMIELVDPNDSRAVRKQTVQSRWENTSVRSRAHAPKPGSLSTASLPSAIMSGPT